MVWAKFFFGWWYTNPDNCLFIVILFRLLFFLFWKTIKSHHFFYNFTGGGIPTLNMLMIIINWCRSSLYMHTKDVSNFTTDKGAVFESWCKFQICHAILRLLVLSLSGHRPINTGVRWHWGTWSERWTQVQFEGKAYFWEWYWFTVWI